MTAIGPVHLQALDKESLVTALTGHAPSWEQAGDIVTARQPEMNALGPEQPID